MSATERSARRRAALSEIALYGTPTPAWGRVELLRALGLELATIDLMPGADRSRAADLVVAIVSKYAIPLDVALPAQINTDLDTTSTTRPSRAEC